MLSAQPANRNGFPAELDDREWLEERCGVLGETTIAAELRVSRKAVRRARERLGISTSPSEPSLNGSTATNGPMVTSGSTATNGSTSMNGSTALNRNGAMAVLAPAPSNGTAAATFVSDEELTRRVAHVKTGLTDVCGSLARLINELEWVRQQVAPQRQATNPPA
jgi:hypothetical protein